MTVRDEIAVTYRQREKFAQRVRGAVPLAAVSIPFHTRAKGVYLPPRIANRFGMFEYARISHQPQESEQANPRETDRTGAVQLLIEPVRTLWRTQEISSRAHR